MKYQITDLIDIDKIKVLMENFAQATGFGTAILDLDGNVVFGTGWKEICTKFHRVNPQTARRCTESDTVLADKLKKGESYNLYKCLSGLVDVAVPIVVNGEHIGNLFTGQFFLEPPDEDFFRKQAIDCGFDEGAYLDALSRVSIFPEDKIKQTVRFLVSLTEFLGEMGLHKLRQVETTQALKSLLDQREIEKNVVEQTMVTNLRRFVLPYLDELEQQEIAQDARAYLNIIRTNIEQLISPVSETLSGAYLHLTPMEIKVADLIRQGKSSKAIAAVLNISLSTVEKHRNKVRKKLNILKRKVNLQTYLNSLT